MTRSIDSTCPPGVLNSIGPHFLQVFNETCFHFVLYKWVSYGEASKACSKFGGTLALPKTKPLNDYLTDQLLNHYDISEDVWIGLHDKKEDTKFVWEDNSDLEWHNFAKRSGLNNPWLISGNEDCVALDPGDEGQWYDYQCDSDLFSWATRSNPKKSYICQYKLGVNSGVQLQGKYRDPSLNKVKGGILTHLRPKAIFLTVVLEFMTRPQSLTDSVSGILVVNHIITKFTKTLCV